MVIKKQLAPEATEAIAAPEIQNPEIKAIDLAALSAPEGSSTDQIELFRDQNIPAPVPAPATPAPGGEKPTGTESTAPPAADAPKISYAGKDYYQSIFDKIKTYTGAEDLKMPDDINDDNFVEKLSQAIYEHTDFDNENAQAAAQGELHPTVQRLQQMLDAKVPVEEALKQLNSINMLNSMSSRDVMQAYLKESFGKSETKPDGWDDNKINETLDKMDKSGVIDLEAEKIRVTLKQHAEQQEKALSEKTTRADAERVTALNKQLEEKRIALQKEMSKKIIEYNDILGVPVSKADMQEFLGDFIYLTTPEEDGIAPGAKLLQSNDNYAKALYMLTRGDTKIKAAVSEAKNKTKIDFLKKLDLEPQLSTRVSDSGQKVVDLDLLEKPDNFFLTPKT